jgi:hypothetical protein
MVGGLLGGRPLSTSVQRIRTTERHIMAISDLMLLRDLAMRTAEQYLNKGDMDRFYKWASLYHEIASRIGYPIEAFETN